MRKSPPTPTISEFNIVKMDAGSDCKWCKYRYTNYAIIRGSRIDNLCGPCARGLLKVLPIIDKGDDR